VPSEVEPVDDPSLPVKRRQSWSYESCIAALVRVLGETDGKALTQRRYARLSRGRTDIPSTSTISCWAKKRGTTLTKMRDEAAHIKYGPRTYAAAMDTSALDTPPAELDQDAVVKKFAAQFEAAENLRAFAWTARPKDRASGGKAYKSLIFAMFARATLTYRAVLHLCRGGYTEQADMLNRSLFEDMAYAHWVSLEAHREEAVDLLAKHTEYSALLANDAIQKHKDWLGEVGALRDVSDLEEKRAEYAKLFGDYGEKSWTTKSIYAVVQEIEQLWPDEETAKKELHGFYSLGHRINNQKLHNTSLSLNTAAKQSKVENGELVIRLGASPTDEEGPMIRALYGALFTYGRITRVLIAETGGNVEEFDDFYLRQLKLLYELAPSKRHLIQRNDQCPCASGKKYKTCHGG
jgi:hypothetical protein